MKKGEKMTKAQKQKISQGVSNRWEEKGVEIKYGARESEDYTTYMREYRREYYEKNRQKLQDYCLERNYDKMTTERLMELREHHRNGRFASDEKKGRIINIIEKVLIKRGVLTTVCDFEHNYTTVPVETVTYSQSASNPMNFEKPNKIEINGVWYDLVESPIQWEG